VIKGSRRKRRQYERVTGFRIEERVEGLMIKVGVILMRTARIATLRR
jgi:hypothetical protein